MQHYMYSWSLNVSLHQVHVLLNSDWTTTCTTEQWLNHMYCWTMTEPLHVLLNNDWTTTCTTDQWLNSSMYYWSVTQPLYVLLITEWTTPFTIEQRMKAQVVLRKCVLLFFLQFYLFIPQTCVMESMVTVSCRTSCASCSRTIISAWRRSSVCKQSITTENAGEILLSVCYCYHCDKTLLKMPAQNTALLNLFKAQSSPERYRWGLRSQNVTEREGQYLTLHYDQNDSVLRWAVMRVI